VRTLYNNEYERLKEKKRGEIRERKGECHARAGNKRRLEVGKKRNSSKD